MSTIDELIHDKVRLRGNISDVLRSIRYGLNDTDKKYINIFHEFKDELKDLEVMRAYEDVLDRKIMKLKGEYK